jgi:hypothetical protein
MKFGSERGYSDKTLHNINMQGRGGSNNLKHALFIEGPYHKIKQIIIGTMKNLKW